MPDEELTPPFMDECAKDFEFGNPPVSIGGKEFVVTNYSESNPTNSTRYTDGYGNDKCGVDTLGEPTANFTIQGEVQADSDLIKNGITFEYEGYKWRVRNRAKSRAINSAVSITFDAARGAKVEAAAAQTSGTDTPEK